MNATQLKKVSLNDMQNTMFFNTLTADGKYSLFNKGNLTHLIQMQLSKKQKTFSLFFKLFWNLN